jgi:uncharacterized protein involved in response to NO
VLRREPFRLFFPLGVVLAWGGVGHWLTYSVGLTTTYSCRAHGLVQVQGFLLAFATGFLLTAIPRRTQSAPPSAATIAAAALALVVGAAAALAERWTVAEAATIATMCTIVGFAVRRFTAASSGRRPPAAFVLVPAGFAQGVAGAVLVAGWVDLGGFGLRLGRLLVEQGLFLSLVAGVGGLVLPLMAGADPPADLGSSRRERRRAVAYAALGAVVLATLVAEAAGAERAAPIARGVAVAAALGLGAGAWRPPDHPGWNRRVAWLAVWLTPTGVLLSGLLPAYRVPALHVTFIGGFALLAIAVGTHVTASHLELPVLRDGRSRVVAIVTASMLVAMVGRVTADAMRTYFEHLGASAAIWIAGSAVWLAALAPAWMNRPKTASRVGGEPRA